MDLSHACVGDRLRRTIAREFQDGPGSPRPNLNDGPQFERAWSAFTREFSARPLFPKDALAGFDSNAHLLLKFGSDTYPDESEAATPEQRPNQLPHPPLSMDADYLALAVACQLVLHMPEVVSGVFSFKQLYGGRLISDVIPEVDHTTFDGKKRRIDHTRDVEDAMRLHVDDADLHVRAAVQLLVGVKNPSATPTTFAAIPPDAVLRANGCDVPALRAPAYQHCPPKLFDWVLRDVPYRPVLFGPALAPMVQGDLKSTRPAGGEAASAWEGLHAFLRGECLSEVVVGPGDVLVLHNLRTIHGRAALAPVANLGDRRWVKRLWLSAPAGEEDLQECACPDVGHPRIFDRAKLFSMGRERRHPDV